MRGKMTKEENLPQIYVQSEQTRFKQNKMFHLYNFQFLKEFTCYTSTSYTDCMAQYAMKYTQERQYGWHILT